MKTTLIRFKIILLLMCSGAWAVVIHHWKHPANPNPTEHRIAMALMIMGSLGLTWSFFRSLYFTNRPASS